MDATTKTTRLLGAVTLSLLAACGGATSSKGGGAGAAAIEGTVVGAGAQALSVAVPGGPSTVTDAKGAFLLADVPAGASSLRLSGAGVDASLSIAAMLAGEYRQVTIAVTRTSASERCERTGTEFHGPIEVVDGTNRTITVAGRLVTFTDATVVRSGRDAAAFTDLQVGQLVEVRGALQADGTVAALLVEIRPDPGPGDAPSVASHQAAPSSRLAASTTR